MNQLDSGQNNKLHAAESVVERHRVYSELNEQEREVLQRERADLGALEQLERQGMTLRQSLVYAQAAGLGDYTVQELVERYPDEQACGEYVQGLLAGGAQAAPTAGVVPMAAASTSFTEGVPDSMDDPKEYLESPFSYKHLDHESVSLNSGSLEYTVTDFTLPGKNGMDLSITRQYSSSAANKSDIDIAYTNRNLGMSYFDIYFNGRLVGDPDLGSSGSITISGTGKNEEPFRIYCGDEYKNYFAASIARQKADEYIEENWLDEDFAVGKEYPDKINGYYWRIASSRLVVVMHNFEKRKMPQTGKRDNVFLKESYGLGYGWKFVLPSIEIETVEQDEIVYKRYLHLENGRSLQLEGSGFKNYALEDLSIEKVNGLTLELPYGSTTYDYKLSYKDGRKAYFQAQKEGTKVIGYHLVAMTDRFDNAIQYEFQSGGGVVITDTLGHKVELVKSGDTMTWKLPDGKQIVYTLSDGQLHKVTDQIGRTTTYNYTTQSTKFSFLGERYNDSGETFEFVNLTSIGHPTGATSHYQYAPFTVCGNETKHSCERKFYVLTARWDVENGSEKNRYTYIYNSNNGRSKMIVSATESNALTALVTTSQFDSSGRTSVVERRCNGVLKDKKSIQYHRTYSFMPAKVTTEVYGSSTMTLTEEFDYDAKGNTRRHIDPMGNVTTMTYQQDYSLLRLKTSPKDEGVDISEEYTLGLDNRVVQWAKVYELSGTTRTLRQVTQYLYDDEYNVCEERRFYGDLIRQDTYHSQLITYENTNPALGDEYKGLFATCIQVPRVRNAEGKLVPSPKGDGVVQTDRMYDAYGRVLWESNPVGDVTEYAYDAIGRLTEERFSDGAVKTYEYRDAENSILQTDESGRATKMLYYPLGEVRQIIDVGSGTVLRTMEYDNNCRVNKEIVHGLEEDGVTLHSYDYQDRPVNVKKANRVGEVLYEERHAYDDAFSSDLQRVTKTILGDANAPSMTTVQYVDQLGRVVRSGLLSSGREILSTAVYDSMGNLLSELSYTDSLKGLPFTLRREYNFGGQVLCEENAEGYRVEYVYDALGLKVQASDSQRVGVYSTFEYDALGRVIEQKVPFEEVEGAICYRISRTDYNAGGDVVVQKDTRNKPGEDLQWSYRSFEYDSRGRLHASKIYDGQQLVGQVVYEYDAAGRITATITGLPGDVPHIVRTTYNLFGEVTSVTDALGQIERYEYDRYGVLVKKITRNGSAFAFKYDAMQRVVQECVVDEHGAAMDVLSTTYSKTNAVLAVENDALRISYGFDERGQKLWEADSNGYTKRYRYNDSGNRISLQVEMDGETLLSTEYTYDLINRLSTVTRGDETIATYSYDHRGNCVSIAYPNGVVASIEHNLANLTTRLVNQGPDGVLSSYEYEYLLDGNQVKKIDHSGRAVQYEYDGAGRLVAETTPEETICYEYDGRGNRVQMARNDTVVLYEYDANNRLVRDVCDQSDGTKLVHNYTYDPNGNQLTVESERWQSAGTAPESCVGIEQDAASMQLWEYDGYNRPVGVYANGHSVAYVYRPDGLRLSKTVDGKVRTHVWDGTNMVLEADGAGSVVATYVRGAELIVIEDPEAVRVYPMYNAHGDVVQLSDVIGSVVRDYEYDAFGVELEKDAEDCNPFRYAGEYFDVETGSIYLRARYYEPRIGRFAIEDPARDGENWYVYSHGNPVKYIDPDGQRPYTTSLGPRTQYGTLYAPRLTDEKYDIRTAYMKLFPGVSTLLPVAEKVANDWVEMDFNIQDYVRGALLDIIALVELAGGPSFWNGNIIGETMGIVSLNQELDAIRTYEYTLDRAVYDHLYSQYRDAFEWSSRAAVESIWNEVKDTLRPLVISSDIVIRQGAGISMSGRHDPLFINRYRSSVVDDNYYFQLKNPTQENLDIIYGLGERLRGLNYIGDRDARY